MMGVLRNIGRVIADSARKENSDALAREQAAARQARIRKVTGRTYSNKAGVLVPDGYKWERQPNNTWRIVQDD